MKCFLTLPFPGEWKRSLRRITLFSWKSLVSQPSTGEWKNTVLLQLWLKPYSFSPSAQPLLSPTPTLFLFFKDYQFKIIQKLRSALKDNSFSKMAITCSGIVK